MGATLHGPRDPAERMPTAALSFPDRTPRSVAQALAIRDVHASAGTQCAPLAHRALGTGKSGTLRLSVGPTTTNGDIDHALTALREVLR